MNTFGSRRPRIIGGLLVTALLATSCAWQGQGKGAGGTAAPDGPRTEYKVGMIGKDGGGGPVKGGTLTMSAYSEEGLLDPADAIVAGSTGGIELAAVYDVLMRYDIASGKLEPQLARDLEVSEDGKSWTLTLRDGVKFSDGKPLDAEAVKWSIDRYVKNGGDEAALWKANVTATETPDDTTVVFRLTKKWPTFGYVLAGGAGMIVAKSAEKGGKFTPVGAGAFKFGSYKPQEETVLEAREDYWDGRPNLDKVRVVYVNDPNAALDALKSKRTQAAFFRDPVITQEALDAGYHGFYNLVALGNVGVINSAPGRPGADARVRKAMFHAIKPEVIYQRAYPGTSSLASNEVFPKFSTWHTGAPALAYDPEKARRLLKEAKADGYDGKVSWLDGQDPASRTTALAVKAMLENVGFDVELDLVRSIADQTAKVAVRKSYDISGWGMSWREAGPFGRMYATLHTKGNARFGMPASPEMSGLIEELQSAETPEAERAVMGRIQQRWNEDVPALVFGPQPELLAWQKEVRGVIGSVNSMVLLDDAWIAR
ncbi:ABC transporter substrate-binding protein [Spirillospora sp. NPDC029432]|uniref:ABC transporter substrate-binding protein n=1 Tax=Spirillospora sp. NPDC029432 TaxID=3154599 RepID=UPI003455B52E